MDNSISSRHVGVAAEAIAAAYFARSGFDISVQYGANQPEYDLIVASGEKLLKVSVKGSQDGRWGLCQSYLTPKTADYGAAIEKWFQRHKPRTILCLVQFKGVPLDKMPQVYLATPREIADRLRQTAGGRGYTILYEKHTWSRRAHGSGAVEEIPPSWKFSRERVEYLLRAA